MTRPKGKDRLIVALDVPSKDKALEIVDNLQGVVTFFKVGWELLMSVALVDILQQLSDRKVFVDLKLPDDIPQTIRRVMELSAPFSGVEFLTLSHSSGVETIKAALKARGTRPKPQLLSVPWLSSLDADDYKEQRSDTAEPFEDALVERARTALDAGCDGLIASGDAIRLFRNKFPRSRCVIVSPAIRPAGSSADDHKRFTTPADAIKMGADYLVVGRPILRDPDPKKAAEEIIREMDRAFEVASRQSRTGEPSRSLAV
jgi:orotidine-5'-phosphate decarboxylase